MKKEVVLLIVIILGLSAYLMFQKADKVAYELPKLPAIDKKDITKIEIQTQKDTLNLSKTGTQWQIGDKQYAADTNKMNNILDALEAFRLTAMVSEAKNYEPYDLTDERKIHVQAWQEGTLKLDFDLGKTAGTHQHTFVKLAGDDRVYHARGNFRNNFDLTGDALRDKQVMKFDPAAIHQVQLKNEKQTLLLSLATPPPEGKKDEAEKTDGDSASPPAPEKQPQHQWKTGDGKDADAKKMDQLLSQLSDLRCQKYVYDRSKADLTQPVYTIVLSGPAVYTLSVYGNADPEKNEFTASSSLSEDPFVLPKWQAEKIMVKFEDLTKSDQEAAKPAGAGK